MYRKLESVRIVQMDDLVGLYAVRTPTSEVVIVWLQKENSSFGDTFNEP